MSTLRELYHNSVVDSLLILCDSAFSAVKYCSELLGSILMFIIANKHKNTATIEVTFLIESICI